MPAAESLTLAVVKSTWPIIVVIAGGLVAWGNIRADVAHIAKQQDEQFSDHDRIVRIEEQQKQATQDIREMKQDLKEIAKAVK